MKPLNPFRQTPGLCGPACLKILLSHYGQEFSESDLATLCNATVDHGTDHADMIDAVRRLGFEPFTRADATLEEVSSYLLDETPVIVGWWSTDGDHYSIVYEIDEENVYLMDPETEEGTRTISRQTFLDNWYDFDGPKNLRIERWMMVIKNTS